MLKGGLPCRAQCITAVLFREAAGSETLREHIDVISTTHRIRHALLRPGQHPRGV